MRDFHFAITSTIKEYVKVPNCKNEAEARAELDNGYQAYAVSNVGEPKVELIVKNPQLQLKKDSGKKRKIFSIKHFDDCHEIESEDGKAIELGCFPVAKHGYSRYFGLFYTGRHNKPTVEEVMRVLRRQVTFGDFSHYRPGDDVGVDEDDVRNDVKTALRG